MGRWGVAAALVLLAACKAELSNDATADASSSEDSSVPDSTDSAVMLGAWGMPALVLGASDDTLNEDDCTLSSNKLEIYFKRTDGTDNNLYMMTRASVTDAWSSPPQALAILNSTVAEESPRLSPDDKSLYFGRNGQIYKSTRAAVGQTWGAPTEVTALNTAAYEKWADVCDNGYAIVSRSTGTNDQDLFEGTVTGGATTAITAFNTASAEQGTLLSADCLRVYFQSNRDNAQFDLFEATRTTPTGQWPNPTKMIDFNTTISSEEDPWVSTDQRVFVFTSNVNGTKDVFISSR